MGGEPGVALLSSAAPSTGVADIRAAVVAAAPWESEKGEEGEAEPEPEPVEAEEALRAATKLVSTSRQTTPEAGGKGGMGVSMGEVAALEVASGNTVAS